ncbi:hypothetical protein AQS70_17700 [Pseudomonas endophytica]|uniref:Glycosyl transferase family 1 domain-containing protein n=1 Tax=Pseudomonas endophytica TaxID=1563157 RepID=A0A0Q0X322_9PSED|nr:glycosyltransferase [Pseudomonas endophytica]KQB51553.1 hypothetical protein AQS70_17700 [Pseudomonas endophytica]
MNNYYSAEIKKTNSIICYHFFPHYRKGVIEELEQEISPTFLADNKGVEGILPYKFNSSQKFIHSQCFYIGKLMLQPYLLWVALTGRYDNFIFLANPNHITTWIASLICRVRKKNVIFWGHGFKSSERTNSNRIRKLFFSLADSFYTYGWRAKVNAISFGFPKDSIHVGFNSLDYEHQLKTRNNLPPPIAPNDKELNIICISRLTLACRYDLLIDSIKIASSNNPLVNFNLTFIGDGPEREKLGEMASMLGINCLFLGEIYDENIIANHISSADVTISPGKIGLTAMHSLMYGTPVISHDNFISQMPEVESIIEGHTGEIFEQDNIISLAEKITSFKKHYPDREKTRQDCFLMIDQIYNPKKQVSVLKMAIHKAKALDGNDAVNLFSGIVR